MGALIFHHRGSMGDIIYSLPTIQAFGGGALWIRKEQHYKFLRVLLSLQPCISEVVNGLPEKRGFVNLDTYRSVERKAFAKKEFRHLAEYHLEALGKEHEVDLTVPWLFDISPLEGADVVVNRSPRYHDREDIDWNLLNGYSVVFVGLEEEYRKFSSFVKDAIYYRCANAYEMARVIRGSKLFVGNQSLGFAIAEAMKHPRVLEVYYNNANCMPKGHDGYIHLDEGVLNRHVCA